MKALPFQFRYFIRTLFYLGFLIFAVMLLDIDTLQNHSHGQVQEFNQIPPDAEIDEYAWNDQDHVNKFELHFPVNWKIEKDKCLIVLIYKNFIHPVSYPPPKTIRS